MASLVALGFVATLSHAAQRQPDGASAYFDDRNGLACAGCHGIAGTGGGEGGITIPPLLGVVGAGSRYGNPRALCRLLATGITPERSTISNLMPRYKLSERECASLFQFTAAFAQPVLGPDDSRIIINSRIDERSAGQTAWLGRIGQQLDQANQAGGIFGRRFFLAASPTSNDRPIVMLDFVDDSSGSPNIAAAYPTIVLQARGYRPLVKAIESRPLDEARALVAAYPGETFVYVDPMSQGPELEQLRTAIDEPATKIVSDEDCANGSAAPTRAIIMSMAATPDQGLSQLLACKELQSAAISLRNVSGEAIAAAAAAARLPAAVSVFAPVPVGEQFSDIPNVVSRIIVEMARRMGANPTRSVQIEAFEQAWKLHARGDGTLFSGAAIADVDPADLSARGAPLWHDAP